MVLVEYTSAEQFCEAAKTEYEYELGRNTSFDNKVSITLAFCGVVLLFLINYLDLRSLLFWGSGATMMWWEYMTSILCFLLQIGCLVFFVLCIIKLFKVLRPRIYYRLDTEYLLDETLPEWTKEQSYMYLGRRYSEFAASNNIVNETRLKEYTSSIKWLLLSVLLCLINEIIKFNFL